MTWSIEFVLYAATEGGERVGWGGGGRGREEEINKRQDSGGGGWGQSNEAVNRLITGRLLNVMNLRYRHAHGSHSCRGGRSQR